MFAGKVVQEVNEGDAKLLGGGGFFPGGGFGGGGFFPGRGFNPRFCHFGCCFGYPFRGCFRCCPRFSEDTTHKMRQCIIYTYLLIYFINKISCYERHGYISKEVYLFFRPFLSPEIFHKYRISK